MQHQNYYLDVQTYFSIYDTDNAVEITRLHSKNIFRFSSEKFKFTSLEESRKFILVIVV